MKILIVLLWLINQGEAKIVTGLVLGKKEITLKAKAQGEILDIKVSEGQSVQEKDIIAIVDDRRARIEMGLAKAEFDLAKQDYESSKKLNRYISNDELRQKEGVYLKKKSVFENKSLDFDFTRILAPTSGVVIKKYFDQGETVSVGDKVFELVQMDELELVVNVDSNEISKIAGTKEIKFKVDEFQDSSFTAKIDFVSPVIDPASGTIRVRLSIKNTFKPNSREYVLKPGMLAKLEI